MSEHLTGAVRPVIALALTAALIYLVVAQLPIPDNLMNIVYLVIGFFFASREATKAITDAATTIAKAQPTPRPPGTRTRREDDSDASRSDS